MTKSRLALSITLLFISSCFMRGLNPDGLFVGKHTEYNIGFPSKGWKQIALRQSGDVSWFNPEDGSTIMANSYCKGVQDAPLEALTQHLFIGMTEQKIITQNKLTISAREALESKAEAKIDGVKRTFQILVLKKDSCVYDVILSSSPSAFENNLPAFKQVVSGLKVGTR